MIPFLFLTTNATDLGVIIRELKDDEPVYFALGSDEYGPRTFADADDCVEPTGRSESGGIKGACIRLTCLYPL